MTVQNGQIADETTFNTAFMSRVIKALGVGIEIDSTTEFSRPYPKMTTAERDAITPLEGDTLYNTDSKRLEIYDGTDWGVYDNVDSVNGKTGVVVLDPDDLDDTATANKFITQAELDKLAGIEDGAEVNAVTSVNTYTGDVALDADDIADALTVNKFATQGELDQITTNLTNLDNHIDDYLAHKEVDTKANLDTWALTAINGSFAFATDEKKSYQVIDAVLTEIGGGGGDESYNIRELFNFENGDPASAYFSVITANMTVDDETTNPIDGTVSAKIGQVSALPFNAVETTAIDISQDIYKKGKIVFAFDFNSNAESGSYTVETIINDGVDRTVSSEVITGELGSFNSEVTLLDADLTIRFKILPTVPNDANILIVDNFRIDISGTQVKEIIAMSEWEDYTPTLIGFGTPSNVNFRYRRVGDSVEVIGKITSGTMTSDQVSVSLPNNLLLDSNKLPPYNTVIGRGERAVASANGNDYTVLKTINNDTVGMGIMNNVSYNPFNPVAGTVLGGSSQAYSLEFTVPIAGWSKSSSGTVFASDTNKEDIVVEGAGNGGESITANVTDIPFIEVSDNTGSWNGSQFIVPETGLWHFKLCMLNTVAINSALFIRVDSSGSVSSKGFNTNSTQAQKSGSGTYRLKKNDVVSFRADNNSTLSNNPEKHYITITKQAVNVDNLIIENFGTTVANGNTTVADYKENTFVGRIANNGTATVKKATQDFIGNADVNRSAPGTVIVDISSLNLSEIAGVTTSNELSTRSTSVIAISTTSITFLSVSDVDGTPKDADFNFSLELLGSDYKENSFNIDTFVIENPEGEFETQEKFLTADSTTTGAVSDLSFNGLEIGAKYVISGQVTGYVTGTSHRAYLNFYDSDVGGVGASNQIGVSGLNNGTTNSSDTSWTYSGVNLVYTATSSEMTVLSYASAGGVVAGDGTKDRTYIQLTKLPKKLGVDQLGEVITNHVTGGTEYEVKGKLVDGKPVYGRMWKTTSDISSNVLIDSIPTGYEVINAIKRSGDYFLDGTTSNYTSNAIDIKYLANGEVRVIATALTLEAGTFIYMEYIKP